MNTISKNQLLYLQKKKRDRILIQCSRILLLFFFLGLWEFSASFGLIDSFVFSSPTKIWSAFTSMLIDGSIFIHAGHTLYETLISFILVILFSILTATLLWFFPRVAQVLDPFFVALNSLPKSALAPLLIVWLGTNQRTIIVAGMSVAIFGSILSLYNSFQQVDPEKIKLIHTLKGTNWHALTKVVLPSCTLTIISLMKVNIGLCLVGVVIGEFLAARSGLGYLIIYSSQVFKMDWLLMSIILLCIMSMLLYWCIYMIEKHWRRR